MREVVSMERLPMRAELDRAAGQAEEKLSRVLQQRLRTATPPPNGGIEGVDEDELTALTTWGTSVGGAGHPTRRSMPPSEGASLAGAARCGEHSTGGQGCR